MEKPIDQEYVYSLVLQKKWPQLLDFVRKNRRLTETDALIQNAVNTFENQFFDELENGVGEKPTEEFLINLFLLHRGNIYQLSEAHFYKVVIELVSLYLKMQDIEKAYKFALLFPEEDYCIKTIQQYESSIPIAVPHSQDNKINVLQNTDIATTDSSTSLFKSPQEMNFYLALRRIYPRYDVYPNVSISCIVDFTKIEGQLTREEKDYYFRGIIDSVVFDQYDDYKPLHCFELDSSYHDNAEQKKKDFYKNKILAAAGLKLFRIRGISGSPTVKEFIDLIRDIIEPNNSN